MIKKIRFFLICILLLTLSAASISMADSENGNIHIEMQDELYVGICQVAKVEEGAYELVPEFAQSGIEISALLSYPTLENAKLVWEYVQEQKITSKEVTSENGVATFSSVKKGIYLVYCGQEQNYRFEPFFIFLTEENVTAVPKMEEIHPDEMSISVVKMWEDNQNASGKRPEKIKIYLLQDGEKIASAELHDGNAWSYTFANMSANAEYTVSEEVVEGYAVSYNGDKENGFVITNTYEGTESKPSTGDSQSVGVLLLLCGVSMMMILLSITGRKSLR